MVPVSFGESVWIAEVFRVRRAEFEAKAQNGSSAHRALLQAEEDWNRAYSADMPKAEQYQARQKAARHILNLLDKITP